MSQVDRLAIQITVTDFTGSPMFHLHESVDGVNFAQVANLTVVGAGVTIWHVFPVFSQFKKIHYHANDGSATFKVQINAHNDTIGSFGGTITKVYMDLP